MESLEDEGKRKGRRKRGEEARTGERGMGGEGGEGESVNYAKPFSQ